MPNNLPWQFSKNTRTTFWITYLSKYDLPTQVFRWNPLFYSQKETKRLILYTYCCLEMRGLGV